MLEALEKIKSELMLLGFISLLLTVGQDYISRICIPSSIGFKMLPCEAKANHGGDDGDNGDDRRRRLLWSGDEHPSWRRFLAAGGGQDRCSKKGKVSLISTNGMHQLHIFIFILAILHVLYCILTMALAQAKMKKWKAWESETTSMEYQFSNDPSRFRLTHQTSFVRRHQGFSSTPGIRWIVAFLRQFFRSVTKVDYLTMRHGFINAHLSPNSKFNFHKYIKRSLEDDFKVVVGISIPLWATAIIFMLLNVNGLHTLFWVSLFPLVVLLLVGMKLEVIIMEMAQRIRDRTTIVKGAPVVEPSNELFWFNRPQWILYLIHFTLFENAFQMAYFLWILYSFGKKSCLHQNMPASILKIIISLVTQFLCSYITFPLYALVTQMGSHMKKAIFEEQTAKALMKWQKAAKERKKHRQAAGGGDSVSGYMSGDTTPSRGTSPVHLLHKFKANSAAADVESIPNSPSHYASDNEISEMEAPTFAPRGDVEAGRVPPPSHYRDRDGGDGGGDFSFVQH
ncbi:hypothetical protein QJS04_geneDACA009796 [Acorus gramineus]|uniref:MLO-like protein n=1 Tax=Acorus gramineus TaxID=55184 RepID=A0AAV9BDI7_ACOGR|nr:hypothetical protein QJS04_geneDACA009796 [Acorus gramineus]